MPCRCSGSTSVLLALLMFPSTLALMTPRGRTRLPRLGAKRVARTCRRWIGVDGGREDRVGDVAGDPRLHGPAVLGERLELSVSGLFLGVGDRRRRVAEEDAVPGSPSDRRRVSWRT